jgi:hypothetical protein
VHTIGAVVFLVLGVLALAEGVSGGRCSALGSDTAEGEHREPLYFPSADLPRLRALNKCR